MEFELKGNFFDGDFTFPKTTGPEATDFFIDKYCPAHLEHRLWRCLVDYSHVDPTIESSLKGFQLWKKTSYKERVESLKRYQEQVDLKKVELSKSISLETGIPIWQSLEEVENVIAYVDILISQSDAKEKLQTFSDKNSNIQKGSILKPIGPHLILGSFIEPCFTPSSKIITAILAGNSIIFKPSEKTCYSGELLTECLIKANFPKGVINLIQGSSEIGRRLSLSKAIKGVFLTGSIETGKKIIQATHDDLRKVIHLELGGKNTTIICEDANIENALIETTKGSFLSSGQHCSSSGITLIHKSILESFIEKFHKTAKKIIVDHPIEFNKEPFMGPLVDKKAVENYLLYMGMAKREGIEEIMRGKILEKGFSGHYVSPSIHLSNTFNSKSLFINSEILGPNCTFIPFEKIGDAINIVNQMPYGFTTSVFTKNERNISQSLNELDVGYINFNKSTMYKDFNLTFTNLKNSGNGKLTGPEALTQCAYQLSYYNSTSSDKEDQLNGLD
jgi:succinylglutamic semialdehyde dehydrogenase